MRNFIVTGNKSIYRIGASNVYDAWKYAIMEISYNFTGNTIIYAVKPENRGE